MEGAPPTHATAQHEAPPPPRAQHAPSGERCAAEERTPEPLRRSARSDGPQTRAAQGKLRVRAWYRTGTGPSPLAERRVCLSPAAGGAARGDETAS
eukprot:4276961-Prymnesium_polylepis.2